MARKKLDPKSNRSSIDFNEATGPVFRKYAAAYGVNRTCSLGTILVDCLTPEQREELMSLVAQNVPVKDIQEKFELLLANEP